MPSYDQCLVEAELRARAAYAEPGRHYHGREHLDHCLSQLQQVEGPDERERRLLGWAILWHDAVYDPRRSDNEEASAELARAELTGCGVSAADAEEVARLILLTKSHRADQGDRLGALIVSIDLAILAADADRYRAYAAAVRREYAHVGEGDWRRGRSAMLRSLLDADPLYPDPDFRERLEARARANIQAELSSLEG